jgi:hypothetical protein
VVLHHLDGLLRRQAPGLLHPGAGHGVHRVRQLGLGFRLVPTSSLRCTSLRRFAPRRQPCRLSTVTLLFLAFRANIRCEPHALCSTVGVRSDDALASSVSAFASGTSLQPTTVFPPWTPPAASRLSARGVTPSRARPWLVELLDAHRLCDDRGVAPQPPFSACVDAVTGLATRHRACALPSASLRTASTGSVSGGHPARGDFPSLSRGSCAVICVATLLAPHLLVVAHLPVACAFRAFFRRRVRSATDRCQPFAPVPSLGFFPLRGSPSTAAGPPS